MVTLQICQCLIDPHSEGVLLYPLHDLGSSVENATDGDCDASNVATSTSPKKYLSCLLNIPMKRNGGYRTKVNML